MDAYLWKSFDFKGSPLELFDLLQGEAHLFFLDSSQYEPSRGRYSFIGCDPFEVFIHKGKETLDLLQKKFSTYTGENPASFAAPFSPLTAGIVGCLSYDYGLHQEKIKLATYDDLNLPDAYFGFYDCVLTIDHFRQKLIITSSGLPEKKSALRQKRAEARLAAVVEKLAPYFEGSIENSLTCHSEELAHCIGTQSDEESQEILQPFGLQDDSLNVLSIFQGNFSKEGYIEAVKKALEYIACGDIYQVNLSQRFEFSLNGRAFDSLALYKALRNASSSSFGGYLDAGDFILMSNSPERFFRLNNGIVQTRPMKGTRRRGNNPLEDKRLRHEIESSAKEKAELLMITDLLRNDLGRVCEYGSVKVKEMRTIEEYSYVFQATSLIEGVLDKNKDGFDLMRACFPGGSITGCPKIRAMEVIEELEPTRRGMYTGVMGYMNFDGNMDFNILIRTLLSSRDKLYFQVGGGIVADSMPEKEYEETLVKAWSMRESLVSVFTAKNRPQRNCTEAVSVKTKLIFLDGQMIRVDFKLSDSLAPGVAAGKGAFETMRVGGGEIENLDDHLTRLLSGLKALEIRHPYTRKQLKQRLSQVIQANHFKNARIRLAIWRENRRLRIAIVGDKFEGYSPEQYARGFKAIIAKTRRPKSRWAHVKSMDYGCFRQAFIEAKEGKCDEALLLNHRHELVEGSRTNIFFIKNNTLYTPAMRCGCLNGITRRRVVRLARQMKIPCRMVAADLDALQKSEEAFVTNSLMGVMPLTAVNGQRIGRKGAGSMTKKLLKAYQSNSHSSCPPRGKSV